MQAICPGVPQVAVFTTLPSRIRLRRQETRTVPGPAAGALEATQTPAPLCDTPAKRTGAEAGPGPDAGGPVVPLAELTEAATITRRLRWG